MAVMAILEILVVLVLMVLAVGYLRAWMVQSGEEQKKFLKGKVPKPLPDGFLKGSVNAPTNVGWQGKTFDAKSSSGFNNIKQGGKINHLFPFKTYVGKGLMDQRLEVFKIDYDILKNPFYMKLLLDELVEVSPKKYLGKIILRLPFGLKFAVGYFNLEKG